MQEFEFDIEYIKGKENKSADCLSRIQGEINETSGTVHSANEQMLDHIPIKEGIINIYQTQLILTYSVQNEIKTLRNNRIIQEDMTKGDKYWNELFKKKLKQGRQEFIQK